MITFTKNVTPGNRKNGEWLLGYYYRNSLLSRVPYYPITNWSAFLQHYITNYPTFIESLGENLGSIESSKAAQAMTALAKSAQQRGDATYPTPSRLAQAMTDVGASQFSFTNSVIEGLEESAIDIGKFSLGLTGVILFSALALGGLYLYVNYAQLFKARK